jgi:flagellar biosynthesis protein FlhB
VAEEGASQGDRTEAATPRRLQRAREQGQVPISRELAGFAGLAAALLTLLVSGRDAAVDLVRQLSLFISHADAERLVGAQAFSWSWQAAAQAAGPLILAVLVAGVGSVLLQTGFMFNASALQLDLGRIDPRRGLARLLSGESVADAAKSLIKLAVMGSAAWHILAGAVPSLMALTSASPQRMMDALFPLIVRIFLVVLIVQFAVAGLDLLWVRYRHLRQLRMSKHDLREELRETEGDPKIKARVRQIRMQRARKRMLAAVPKATVVLTNPTHYAVALKYDRATHAAPRVIAKGVDLLAERIRDVARERGIPVVPSPALARALYRVELDTDIPPEHYQAVAEIIAYVWGLLKSRRPVHAA